eukprot:2911175-Pleurochrysis_carterae.AAC.4
MLHACNACGSWHRMPMIVFAVFCTCSHTRHQNRHHGRSLASTSRHARSQSTNHPPPVGSRASMHRRRARVSLRAGALIFQGVMRAAPPREQLVSAMGDRPADFVQSVIFTDNQAIIDAEAEHIYNQASTRRQRHQKENAAIFTLSGTPASEMSTHFVPYFFLGM